MSHPMCPKRGTEHPPHPFRWYVMGGIVHTRCDGEVEADSDRAERNPAE